MKKGPEKQEEDITARVTRHAARNKTVPSSEIHPSRDNPHVSLVVLSKKIYIFTSCVFKSVPF